MSQSRAYQDLGGGGGQVVDIKTKQPVEMTTGSGTSTVLKLHPEYRASNQPRHVADPDVVCDALQTARAAIDAARARKEPHRLPKVRDRG